MTEAHEIVDEIDRELDYNLYQHISLDAIHLLESHPNAAWKLVFDLPDGELIITAEGDLEFHNIHDTS